MLNNFVCFQMHNTNAQVEAFYNFIKNYLFLKNNVSSKGSTFYNVLYFQ